MQTHLRHLAVAAALTFGASAVAAIPAMAQQDENHPYQRNGAQAQRTDPDTYANHPDYSNNDYYRTGNDEGYQDYKAKKQREKHEHQYRDDNDRKAHDYGYQEGWSGRSYNDTQRNRNTQTYGDNQRYRDNQNGQYRDNQNSQYRENQNSQSRENQKHDKDDENHESR